MSQILLKSLDIEDIEEILAIERMCFKSAWSREVFANEVLSVDDFYCIGAKIHDTETGQPRLVGFIVYWDVYQYLHIINIAVHQDYRNIGIGRRLICHAMEFTRANNIRIVMLEVRRSNIVAQKLYQKFGFEKVGVKRGYYPDGQEDALMMALRMGPKRKIAMFKEICNESFQDK